MSVRSNEHHSSMFTIPLKPLHPVILFYFFICIFGRRYYRKLYKQDIKASPLGKKLDNIDKKYRHIYNIYNRISVYPSRNLHESIVKD